MRRSARTFAIVGVFALIFTGCEAEPAEPTVRTVAFLRAVPNPESPVERAVLSQLARVGYSQGEDLRLLGGDDDDVYPTPEEARAAVQGWVEETGLDLIFAFSTSGAAAAHEAAPGVPVVFLSNDPVSGGLVTDPARPDLNMTGVTFQVPADRTLDIARRAIPNLNRIGLAYPASDAAGEANRRDFEAAAGKIGIDLVDEVYEEADGIDDVVRNLATDGDVDALVLSTSPAAARAMSSFEQAATANGLPVVANFSLATFAVVVLYPDGNQMGIQMGRQAAQILEGAEPSTISVQNPRRFTLELNAAAAAELGVALPDDLLREADHVRR